eukprot:gnl/TRDRNA2_/TRDRNA2_84127_c0_seq3.p1 gnl/TRDRNA2_/TRDRNA2_84127_c0~~gnl/TRDRNA2_/TRDRNA2_84127_c0_seq3.p1  ORF type:complete len:476 (-),score=102.76 gnl/TRDRNA2_/TRDRNA2_84127_c0_seq3:224-1651(-)
MVVLKGCSKYIHAAGDWCQFICSYILLQISVAWISGALVRRPFSRDKTKTLPDGRVVYMPITEQKADRELGMKCWATLFAHTTGFSAINFGGAMQHGSFFLEHPHFTFVVIPVMYFGQNMLGAFVLFLRDQVVAWQLSRVSPSDPQWISLQALEAIPEKDRESEEEQEREGKEYAIEKWQDEVFESENDIAGLQVSFLTVQAVRFNITGVLPNNLGIEEEDYLHPVMCSVKLFGFSMICVVLTMLLVLYLDEKKKRDAQRQESPTFFQTLYQKMLMVMVNATSMAFAWCQLYIFKWEVVRRVPHFGSPNTLTAEVILALGISVVAFIIIFFLDKIADSPITGDSADHVIESIIASLGILVGFSWEQSFDGAVETIAALTPDPILAEMVLAIIVVLVVIAPWRLYILSTVVKLDEERTEKKEAEREEERKNAEANGNGADEEMPLGLAFCGCDKRSLKVSPRGKLPEAANAGPRAV